MGCNPVTMVDPLGLQYFAPGENRPNVGIPNAGIHVFEDGTVAVFGGNSMDLETRLLQADERFTGFMIEAFLRKALGIGNRGSGKNGSSSASGKTSGAVQAQVNGVQFNIGGTNHSVSFSDGSLRLTEILEPVEVKEGKANWEDWGKRMYSRYGNSLNYNFDGYGKERNTWFFEYGAEVTVGLQVGGAVSVGELNAGLKGNLVSAKLWEFKRTQVGSDTGPYTTKFNWVGKDGKYSLSNGVDLGPFSMEQSFDRNIGQTGYIEDSRHYKNNFGPFTYHTDPNEGSYIQIEIKAALILGISGSVKFGLRK